MQKKRSITRIDGVAIECVNRIDRGNDARGRTVVQRHHGFGLRDIGPTFVNSVKRADVDLVLEVVSIRDLLLNEIEPTFVTDLRKVSAAIGRSVVAAAQMLR